MQTLITLLQTGNNANTSSLNLYALGGFADAKPTVSKHRRKWLGPKVSPIKLATVCKNKN